MIKKVVLFLLTITLTLGANAQIKDGLEKRHKKRSSGSPFSKSDRVNAIYSNTYSQYRPFGWHASAGLTYMYGHTPEDNNTNFNLTPSGLPGYYLEGGLAHLFKKRHKALHYFDYGLGVKHYGGMEKYTDSIGEAIRGTFNYGSAFARIDLHSAWQLSKWNWIDQSIGFNLDYRIYGGNIDPDYFSPAPTDFQEKLVAQLHYTIGWGYKPRDGFFIIPTIQTPILTLLTFRDYDPGTRWFSSKYQPIIFTVKMGVLFPKKGCPKVFSKDAKRQSEQFQNR